jgi:hypothetical protein
MEPGLGRRVVTVHDLNYLYGRNAFSTWRHHRRTRALLHRTDVLVAISRHTAQDVRQHLGWPHEIPVIYNGARSFVDTPREPLPGWPATDTAPFLFHLSRMSASKNPGAIIALARQWPQMRFVLCGPPSDDARRLRATVHLPNVQFHLGISDAHKAWAYAQCTGFVFPSLTEGFGLPPIEAMHFGKPVFLARRTCLPEIGGDAADYFDDFDPVQMRTVVERGLARFADPDRAQKVRQHAAQFEISGALFHGRAPKAANAMRSATATIRSNSASSRRSSIRWQAWSTVVRSRPKPRPTSPWAIPSVTWATYIAIWRTRATSCAVRPVRLSSLLETLNKAAAMSIMASQIAIDRSRSAWIATIERAGVRSGMSDSSAVWIVTDMLPI